MKDRDPADASQDDLIPFVPQLTPGTSTLQLKDGKVVVFLRQPNPEDAPHLIWVRDVERTEAMVIRITDIDILATSSLPSTTMEVDEASDLSLIMEKVRTGAQDLLMRTEGDVDYLDGLSDEDWGNLRAGQAFLTANLRGENPLPPVTIAFLKREFGAGPQFYVGLGRFLKSESQPLSSPITVAPTMPEPEREPRKFIGFTEGHCMTEFGITPGVIYTIIKDSDPDFPFHIVVGEGANRLAVNLGSFKIREEAQLRAGDLLEVQVHKTPLRCTDEEMKKWGVKPGDTLIVAGNSEEGYVQTSTGLHTLQSLVTAHRMDIPLHRPGDALIVMNFWDREEDPRRSQPG